MKVNHRHDDGGSKHLWNVGELPADCPALQPRRQPSSYVDCLGNFLQDTLTLDAVMWELSSALRQNELGFAIDCFWSTPKLLKELINPTSCQLLVYSLFSVAFTRTQTLSENRSACSNLKKQNWEFLCGTLNAGDGIASCTRGTEFEARCDWHLWWVTHTLLQDHFLQNNFTIHHSQKSCRSTLHEHCGWHIVFKKH
jgi:hypothetical protein